MSVKPFVTTANPFTTEEYDSARAAIISFIGVVKHGGKDEALTDLVAELFPCDMEPREAFDTFKKALLALA